MGYYRRIYRLCSATNILGPLKSRLQREMGTSNAQFGLLLSAYSLNGTWTPLVGGILASRLGTTLTSILATGIILLGEIAKAVFIKSANRHFHRADLSFMW
jgi:MFS family permease